MKLKAVTLFALMVFVVGCGSGSGSGGSGSGGGGATQFAGTWNITVSTTAPGYSGSVFHVTLVSGPCTIQTAAGTFGELSQYCFIAEKGQGAISETGSYFYAPQAVLVDATASSVSKGPVAFAITFIESNPDVYGDVAVFSGLTGTLTSGGMSGTWVCAYGPCTVTTPQGGITILGGTFTGSN
jgi:hypothetical protein